MSGAGKKNKADAAWRGDVCGGGGGDGGGGGGDWRFKPSQTT